MTDLVPSEKQRALTLLKQMQSRLDAAERRAREPVAVIGIGCRLPGGPQGSVEGADAFWDRLTAGTDAVREVPPERWDAAAWYDPDPDAPGKANTRWGGFLDDVDRFDAEFFGVSPREAVSMDPQQRLVLETAWRALEHAGVPVLGLAGSRTGVFLGVCTSDYARLGDAAGGCGALDTYSGTGGACGVAAGRLSYTLGLTGPSLVVDTACSSSLVATHLAVQALRLGECDLALAGGVNLTLSPDGVVTLSKLRMMAPDGRCKPFDAAADGFVRGEGCGVVVLKRLADARAAGDRVLAVISGSAVNQDGRSSGLTAPSGLAQEAVIRQALANAGRTPGMVDYVEAHGTGTALGDPIEMNALAAVMGEERAVPLVVGSVKSNLGHLEAAAGIAGLIKAVGVVRHRAAPPTLHFHRLNPDIETGGTAIRVAAGGMTPLAAARPVAGVSSFGFSGTNAHLVVEAAEPSPPEPEATDGLAVLVLSARSPAALARLVAETAASPALDDWPAAAAALAVGRSAFEHRVAVVAADAAEARRRLRELAIPDDPVPPAAGPVLSGVPEGDRRAGLETLAAAFVAGASVDWRGVFAGTRRFVDGLPGHPFLRKRYWRDGARAQAGGHPLLADRVDLPDGGTLFRARLPAAGAAYLREHGVGGRAIMPAAALLELATGAFRRCGRGAALADVAFEAPLTVEGAVEILVSVAGDRLTVSARGPAEDAGPWIRCLSARAAGGIGDVAPFDMAAVATAPVEAPALYRWLAAGGVAHGPLFRRVVEARQGPGAGWAALAGLDPAGHALHPAVLDAAFQALAVMTWRSDDAGGPGADGPMRTPVAVRRFALTGTGKADGPLTAHARLTVDNGAEWVADVALLDGDGCCVALAEGLALAGGARPAAGGWRDWLLTCDWPPLPPPADAPALAAAARSALAESLDDPGIRVLAGLGARLDALAAAYATRALERVPADVVVPRHRALAELLRGMAAAAPDADPTALVAALRTDYPMAATEIALLRRCGEGLAGALAGTLDPLDLLFPAADSGDGNVYRDSPASAALNRAVQAALLAAFPATGSLRLLEAGAGTGGTTDGLMACLPAGRMAEYAVTDIAPTLLAAAADRYADRPWARVARLDLEAEPEAQGFQPGRYHAVVAANVVHATRDLTATLARLRRLLAPGGALVLLEGRGRQGWVDLCFGLTEGWWALADHAIRPDHPMPDAGRWLAVLEAAGFEAASASVDEGPFARQLVLTARRRADDALGVVGDGPVGRALAQALAARFPAAGEPDTLVCTEALDMPLDDGDVEGLLERQRAVLDGVRRLALEAAGRGRRLVLLTAGATTGARPLAAPAWGLGRAIAAELPELAVLQIDIDPDLLDRGPEAVAGAVAECLRRRDGEDQIRLGVDGRRVVRLRPAVPEGGDGALAQAAAARIDGQARYLVTGGFGGLGLRTAAWLADRGARELVLMGRSAPGAAAEAGIAALEARGVTVWRVRGDAGDAADLRAALATGRGRLAGAVHAAGVLDDGLLGQLDWSRMATVLRPKLAGAWLLDRLAGPLDFLLLYSSAVGLVGTRGQANHIAANAYLDALAAGRTARGAWTVSLAWGAWSAIGSAAGPEIARRLREQGMDVIPPDQGVGVLDWALAGGPLRGEAGQTIDARIDARIDGRVGVLPIRLAAFGAALAGEPAPILTDLLAPLRSSTAHPAPIRPAAPAAPSGATLLDRLRAEAAAVLAADGIEAIDPRRNLFDLGLDSLMAVELRNRLQNALGVPLSPTLLFDHPSCARLAAHLEATAAPPPAASPRPLVIPPPAMEGEEAEDADAIAIIGMDCRFPGGADGPEAFWERLLAGFDAVGEFPADRWDRAGAASRMTTRWGAFLDGVDRFDAAFFHIAPREAASMDPQQRLWLETAWRALEAAGQPPDRLAGSPTGVFVGLCNYDYPQIAASGGRIDAWSGTGGAPSIVAGRLSYLLGLEGPALVVDTACSSSLVAVHLACRGLIDGDCRMAVAGGVNLILAPSSTIALSELQMMAPDGRCKAFDAAADGFVRGEGCGVVVLKRLADARADGDPVLAVIRGSAVNQDGRSSSLTAPSGRAQEAVLRAALARGRMAPERIGCVEAHGTGTALGDPIEIHALKAVFGPGRDPARPLAVGAVKTNLGHLEAAAGIAGLIKTVLALRHGVVPPNNHMTRLNPHIALDGFPVLLPTAPTPWPAIEGLRAAGVSAFGFSGTNVHLTLEQAPERAPSAAAPPREVHLLVASGATAEAARRRAADLADALEAVDGPGLGDLAHTALAGRAHLDFRVVAVAASPAEAARRLREAHPPETAPRPPRIGWVFTGQGAQRAGMGRALYRDEPVFRASIDRTAAAMADLLDRPLTDILWGEASARIHRTGYAQPALFAVGLALAELHRHWGLGPAAVLGHSVGEYVAAAVAGAADADDLARLIAARGALMQALPPGGAMAAVMAGAETVAEAAAGAFGDDAARLSVAAVNGPANTVISGDAAALDRALARLDAAGIVARRLTVSHAFHSPLLEPMLDGLERAAGAVAWRAPRIPVFGNLTGGIVERYDAGYWRRHARAPVLFAEGVRGMAALGCDVFLELGPQPVLSGMGRRVLPEALWLSSLDGTDLESAAALNGLSALFRAGAAIDGRAVSGGRGHRIVATPPYPFERQRHWVDPVAAPAPALVPARPVREPVEDLVGRALRGPGPTRRFETVLSVEAQPWLADHRVRGRATLPAAAMAVMLSAASGGRPLSGLRFHALLEVGEERLAQTARDGDALALHAAPPDSDDWELVAEARAGDLPALAAQDLAALRARCPEAVEVAGFYAGFPAQGIAYGPAFRPIAALHAGRGEALARLVPPAGLTGDGLRAALLDGAFQSLGAAAGGLEAAPEVDGNGYLPVAMAAFHPLRAEPGVELWVWSRLARREDGTLSGDVTLLDGAGQPLAGAVGLILRPNPAPRRAGGPAEAAASAGLFECVWSPATPGRALPGSVRVVGAGPGLTDALARRLAKRGVVLDEDGDLVLFQAPGGTGDADEGALRACVALHGLAVGLIGRPRPPRLVVLTRGAVVLPGDGHAPPVAAAALWGAVASLRIEHPELDAGLIDLPPGATDDEAAVLLPEALSYVEPALGLRGGAVLARALTARPWPGGWGGGLVGLERPASGRLDDLAFRPLDPAGTVPGPGEVAIDVTAAGLNFRDVMNALGSYPGDGGRLGGECAGIVAALGEGVAEEGGLAIGQPVMAVAAGGLATRVVAKASLTLPIPAGWSHEQAATLPTVFLTAAHALRGPGRLAAGERVLIHAGTGGLGMAAIQIARALGAEVLATAGTDDKRALLRGMGVAHVGDSRSPGFAAGVLAHTGGRGVDVVLNALSGPMIAAGFDVLAPGGRFLEVGKAGVWTAEQARAQRPDAEYAVIALDRDIVADPAAVGRLWRGLMVEFAAGTLRPLPVTAFPLRDPEPAFRHMQAARHTGRIALTRRTLRADALYLVTGGTGAIGRALARRLAADGAGTVVLAARRDPDPALAAEMAGLAAWGCAVRFVRLDVSDPAAVAGWLDGLDRPLAGIFHAAGVLDDGVFARLTPERFAAVLTAKLTGALVLDRLTRDRALDLFVLFSSAAGLLGSAGQAAYAAANAGLDALALRRRAAGLPATAVAWGAWAGGGMAARRDGPALSPDTALAALDDVLAAGIPQAAVLPVVGTGTADREAGTAPAASGDLRAAWSAAEPVDRPGLLRAAVRERAVLILGLPAGGLDGRRPLHEYGLDSLMAVELRNALAAALGAPLPAGLIFDHPGIDALAGFLAERLADQPAGAKPAEPPPPETEPPPGALDLDAMNEQDLARALMEEMDRAGY